MRALTLPTPRDTVTSRPRIRCDASTSSNDAPRRVGRIKSIETFPLKGARGVSIEQTTVHIGTSVPRDREFALLRSENEERWGSDDVEASAGRILRTGEKKDEGHHSNKHLFHQLITDPSLAKYRGIAIGSRGLAIECAQSGEVLVRCEDYDEDASGRRAIETFFASRLETARAEAPPTLTRAEGHSFTNVGGRPKEHVLHINTVPSVRAVYDACTKSAPEGMRETLDEFAMRFRPNIVVEDESGRLRAFDEFEWCNRNVRIGSKCVLRVNEPTIRCPSTRVRYEDSETDVARPDVDIRTDFPDLRASIFGRDAIELASKGSYLGLYAVAIVPGSIEVGDDVYVL
ncbi:Molybdenum cofactor sulfurase, C-terminal [Ostreococcus tauri]|uniref:Molybdenum cofactor sulfurase, C-terminal n=1 Tax=Ostreococcus tauri TaxID=70448 RepID=Q017V8_OSTTA|nr:Molybdenum cofactor sulfurase, C-terminal [Ostreococcus tauri]CAL53303.1 Molybdenum cofactor sulfurase, C-terminal [Ostreococcus tauri]|eukprot:XP_003079658.1 Molybdenum cofactor sulfurase, C-terminal [Ostreococcus tauri]